MDKQSLTDLHRAHIASLSKRTAEVLRKNGFDALVLHSGMPVKRTLVDDQYWALRPTPHFQHWAPLAEPGCAVVFEPGKKPKLVRLVSTSFWEGPAPLESDHFLDSFDVIEVRDPRQIKDHLPPARTAFVGDEVEAASALGLDRARTNPPPLVAALDQLRVHKTSYEVACLAEANRRAAAGHEELRRLFAGGDRAELDLHLAYLGATRQDDAETPYKNIVALDAHAATLHHISYQKHARPSQSMLVDAGASFAGYGSDVTRTWVKGSGEAASRFAELVSLVDAMQQRLCAGAEIGMKYEALHDESHRQVGGILHHLGIVKTSAEEADAKGITRAFYPHGLGHALGLQTHDVGCAVVQPRADNPFLRNTTVISEGQVFTIEPGIYFIEGLLGPVRQGPHARDVDWKLVDALAPLGGVRIEDDVVVQAHGVRNLTREVLREGGGAA
ncbi:MAG: Xaa-Pro dipeptidase [Myxococcales bacterium]